MYHILEGVMMILKCFFPILLQIIYIHPINIGFITAQRPDRGQRLSLRIHFYDFVMCLQQYTLG